MRSKAYDFYVHLREGHMIQFQNVTAIEESNPKLQMLTTADMQQQPVEFHVLPTCNDTDCTAAGDYLNDDGVILNLTNNRNIYSLAFGFKKGGSPQTLTFSLTHVLFAQNYPQGVVNMNDLLGGLFIYNANALNLKGTYNVSVTTTEGTSKINAQGVYDAYTDRLVIKF